MERLLTKQCNVFSMDSNNTPVDEINIDVIDEKPIRMKSLKVSPRQTKIFHMKIKVGSGGVK